MSVLPDRWQYSLTVLKRLQGWRERDCPICGYQGRIQAIRRAMIHVWWLRAPQAPQSLQTGHVPETLCSLLGPAFRPDGPYPLLRSGLCHAPDLCRLRSREFCATGRAETVRFCLMLSARIFLVTRLE